MAPKELSAVLGAHRMVASGSRQAFFPKCSVLRAARVTTTGIAGPTIRVRVNPNPNVTRPTAQGRPPTWLAE
jgi:hypothetical protein